MMMIAAFAEQLLPRSGNLTWSSARNARPGHVEGTTVAQTTFSSFVQSVKMEIV